MTGSGRDTADGLPAPSTHSGVAPASATRPDIYLQDDDFTLYCGDVLETLRELQDDSYQCIVTSPPYWGLRDYGTGEWEGGDPDCDHAVRKDARIESSTLGGGKASTGHQREGFKETCPRCGARRVDRQLGLEPTPGEYVERMVEVFRELRRVLRPDGTCWLNIGDSYARPAAKGVRGPSPKQDSNVGTPQALMTDVPPGPKEKDLVGVPWRLAFALQADGWYLRSEIIWSKPNPMPESVTDRPSKSHEQIFLLTKSPRYYFDQEAIREPFETKHAPGSRIRETQHYGLDNGGNTGLTAHLDAVKARLRDAPQEEYLGEELGWPAPDGPPRGPDGRRKTTVVAGDGSAQHRDGERWPNEGRNARTVWEIVTQPYPGAHFATFPEELARRCIAAGTSEKGCCPACGAPWLRETEIAYVKSPVHGEGSVVGRHYETGSNNWDGSGVPRLAKEVTTTGWRRSCLCAAEFPCPTGVACTGCRYCETERERLESSVPCVVLDPFMGAGTTAHVARKLGRRSEGIELNLEYCALIAERLQQLSLLA